VRIEELKREVALRKQAYERRVGQKEALEEQLREIDEMLARKDERQRILEEANQILQATSEQARDLARKSVEAIVTEALRAVFGDTENIRAKIAFHEVRQKPEAELLVVTDTPDGEVEAPPEDANGGGVVDVVTLATRLAEIELYADPPLQGAIWLDEPTRNISSPEYRQAVAQFLADYTRRFGRQMIVVTQHQETVYAADKAFTVQMVDGVSKVEEIDQLAEVAG